MDNQRKTAGLVEDIDEQDVKERAYEAVESASKWLARERREAEQQGILPYSDLYTTKYAAGEEESGYMSSAEGMTALFMVSSHSQEESSIYISPRIDDEILTADVEWILDNNDERGIEQNVYRATPYLPRDSTTSFTDAVSFTTTSLQEALKVPNVNIDDGRLIAALTRNKQWLLENYVEAPGDSDGIGWAWCGATEMDKMDYDYPPQRYFTFSGAVALTDLYLDSNVDTDNEKVENVLSNVLKHLLSDYWVETGGSAGWTEFINRPYGQDLEPHTFISQLNQLIPSTFSTSNTLFAVSYMYRMLPDRVWENAGISDEEIGRIHKSIDYLTSNVSSQLNDNKLEDESAEYRTDAKEKIDGNIARRGYVDGSQPYTILNALIGITNAGGPFDYRGDEIEDLKLATTDYILKNCWTGDTGFKHFQEEFDDEPVVIYATQLGIESLLSFGIEAPTEGVKNKIMMQLEETQKEISQLLEEQPSASQSASPDDTYTETETIMDQNQEFTDLFSEVHTSLSKSFNRRIWTAIDKKMSKDVRADARSLSDDELETYMKSINVDEFLNIINECYHTSDPDEFRSTIQYYIGDYEVFLLKPQKEAIEQLQSVSEEDQTDLVQRFEIITSILDEFSDDPLAGYDEDTVATAFRDEIEEMNR